MAIIRKIPQTINVKKRDIKKSKNKYINIIDGVGFLDLTAVRDTLLSFPSPLIDGQHGVMRYVKDAIHGLQKLPGMIDQNNEHLQTLSNEKIEQFIFTAVSLYLFKEPGKFPVETEDPDDMPPIDNALNEIGITINDFKI